MRSMLCLSISISALVSLIAAPRLVEAAPISPDKTIDVPPPNAPPPPPPPPKFVAPPADGFSWKAESRAERWEAAWRPAKTLKADTEICVTEGGVKKCRPAEQIYDPDYVNPKSFNIFVSGCVDETDWKLNRENKAAKRTYVWTANGQTFSGPWCEKKLTFPAQGAYPVTLAVNGKTYKQVVRVRDILIVALGDSMSSGEGSPHYYHFPGTPYRPAGWADMQCHRSRHAPAFQAAKTIEAMDPSTSVTFISFACSGATLDTDTPLSTSMFNAYTIGAHTGGMLFSGTGLLGPYIGIESPFGEHTEDIIDYKKRGGRGVRESQVDQLKRALDGKRKADVVVMSAGINDARFSSMIHTCVLYTDCPKEGIGSAASKMPLEKRFDWDTSRIPGMYKKLGEQLNSMVNRVLVLEYPNAFTNENKKTCDVVLDDAKFDSLPSALRLGIDASESNWIQNVGGPKLHSRIKEGVALAGSDWEFVPGAWEAFKGHGYCAKTDPWIETATSSDTKQGPSRSGAKGTIHPNFWGYQAMAKIIVKALTGAPNNSPPRARSDAYTAEISKILRVDADSGVLANDWDLDIIAKLTVKSFTQPTSGKAKVNVNPDGSFEYNPAGVTGEDSFFYTVTDGYTDATGRVKITVTGNAVPSGPPQVKVGPLQVRP